MRVLSAHTHHHHHPPTPPAPHCSASDRCAFALLAYVFFRQSELPLSSLKSLCVSADGAMPWRAEHQRRTLLYRYSSRGFSAHSGVEAPAGPAYREELSPLGQAILECANDHLLPAHLARLVQPLLCNGAPEQSLNSIRTMPALKRGVVSVCACRPAHLGNRPDILALLEAEEAEEAAATQG